MCIYENFVFLKIGIVCLKKELIILWYNIFLTVVAVLFFFSQYMYTDNDLLSVVLVVIFIVLLWAPIVIKLKTKKKPQ